MSGYDNIMDWALEHYPFEDFDTFEEWFSAVDLDFQNNMRNPLTEIFDSNDISRAREEYDLNFEEVQIPDRFKNFFDFIEGLLR